MRKKSEIVEKNDQKFEKITKNDNLKQEKSTNYFDELRKNVSKLNIVRRNGWQKETKPSY